MAKWSFTCIDNGGKHQHITVQSASKPEAIQKAWNKAKAKAAGDITNWNCTLIRA